MSHKVKNTNYMFFGNLEQMKRQIDIMMEMDPDAIDHLLCHGHDWADDHITVSKEKDLLLIR